MQWLREVSAHILIFQRSVFLAGSIHSVFVVSQLSELKQFETSLLSTAAYSGLPQTCLYVQTAIMVAVRRSYCCVQTITIMYTVHTCHVRTVGWLVR